MPVSPDFGKAKPLTAPRAPRRGYILGLSALLVLGAGLALAAPAAAQDQRDCVDDASAVPLVGSVRVFWPVRVAADDAEQFPQVTYSVARVPGDPNIDDGPVAVTFGPEDFIATGLTEPFFLDENVPEGPQRYAVVAEGPLQEDDILEPISDVPEDLNGDGVFTCPGVQVRGGLADDADGDGLPDDGDDAPLPGDGPPAAPVPDLNCPDVGAEALQDASIRLGWSLVDDATEFRVYRAVGGAATFDRIATVGGDVTTFQDENLDVGTTYRYVVTSVVAGIESAGCPVVEATAIPFFGSLPMTLLGAAGAVGAVLVAGRRRFA